MRMRLGSAGMIAGAMVSVLVCYTVSLRVSAERSGVDRLRAEIASNMKDIRALEAELKTRARLPQLQRWNDNVLALSAPTSKQYVGDGVQLASFAPNAPALQAAVVQAPTTQLAVATEASPIVPQRPSGLVTVAYAQPAAMPTMVQPTVVTPRQLIEATRPQPVAAVVREAAKPAVDKKPVAGTMPEPKAPKPEVKLAKLEPKPVKPEPVRTAEAKPAKRVDPLGDLIGDIDTAAASEVRSNAGGAL